MTLEKRRDDPKLVVITWLMTRVVYLLVLFRIVETSRRSVVDVLSNWDVAHFTGIATEGYVQQANQAFFPGLPLLMRLLDAFGINMVIGAAIAANIASLLAVWALYRLFGSTVACLWCLAPMGVFTAVGYTESFFAAAGFWAWQRADARRWGQAAALAGLACTLRVSGLFLIAGLGIMALVQDERMLDRIRNAAWLLVPAAVLGAHAVFLYRLTGDWGAWYSAQNSGWQRSLAWPWEGLRATWPMTSQAYWAPRSDAVAAMFRWEIVSVIVGYVTVVWCLVRRRWAEAAWVGAAVLALSCSGWFISVNRAVLLWFPTFVLIGDLLSRRVGSRITRWLVGGALVLADVATMAWWAWQYGTGGWAS
ncbi:hypothetical protein HMPREF1531_00755 [Propionibacterium sp. oral taxon 192 str. F0372]|uniref:mannosyltransferase family protein n=1 Tax=Propionibacterium sp. oral taxon 192 TaxID=671222 RepID=UPI000354729D|nr:mannosyltransferase family protein [Propionibacterium sp. oral taxon 192]EPH06107.1 hypothetical protein HMPREF1531_00755 [Propionibacterium sp. oral taxon 192 str. F0372]